MSDDLDTTLNDILTREWEDRQANHLHDKRRFYARIEFAIGAAAVLFLLMMRHSWWMLS